MHSDRFSPENRAAAPACLAVASDQAVGDEVRLSAAEQLAALDLTG